jgi:hypothetical protein
MAEVVQADELLLTVPISVDAAVKTLESDVQVGTNTTLETAPSVAFNSPRRYFPFTTEFDKHNNYWLVFYVCVCTRP